MCKIERMEKHMGKKKKERAHVLLPVRLADQPHANEFATHVSASGSHLDPGVHRTTKTAATEPV